jgi:hypothetical protein
MLREKALQTEHGFDATLWETSFRDEIKKVTGRTVWTSMYSFIRAACCPNDVWALCIKLLDAWDTYDLKGLKAPAEKKAQKNRAVPKALSGLYSKKPKTRMAKNPKRFPHTTFERMFTGIPMDATKLMIGRLLRKEVGFKSIVEVCALFVLVLCCLYMCISTFLFCFISSSTNRNTMLFSWTP